MSAPNVHELFLEGQIKLIRASSAKEVTKVGTLRAGNTGMLTAEGKIVGPCMALTHLRFRGIDIKGSEDDGDNGGAAGRELMFEGGRTNEDSWAAVLEQSWDGPILREEEIATRWQTSSGIPVTGRPDLVLCRSIVTGSGAFQQTQVNPVLGIELKQVSSLWTAYTVRFKGQPKFNHLLQAAHYSWQLGVPYELWYTSRTDYHIPDWIKAQLPKAGAPGSEALAYSYYMRKEDGGKSKISKLEYDELPSGSKFADPLKVTPFITGYKIELRAGILFYAAAGTDRWVKTAVSIADIQNYYEMVPQLTEVPPEPALLKADGTRENYKARDYCALGPLCCAYNAGREMSNWIDEIQEMTQVSTKDADK